MRAALRIAAFLIFLEIFFRLGGLFASFLQSYSAPADVNHSTYRILCIGDSITALGGKDAYPKQLEKILSEQFPGKAFDVINKGFPGATTGMILSNLNEMVSFYKPNMVIFMLGLQDAIQKGKGNRIPLLEQWRTYNALNVVMAHIQRRPQKAPSDLLLKDMPQSLDKQLELAKRFGELRQSDEQEKVLHYALEMYPDNIQIHFAMAEFYNGMFDFPTMEKHVEFALSVLPDQLAQLRPPLLNLLARALFKQGHYDQAESIYAHLLSLTSNDPANQFEVWGQLTELFLEKKDFEHARSAFLKQIAIDPKRQGSYHSVIETYGAAGKYQELEDLLRTALASMPQNTAYFGSLQMELGNVLVYNHKNAEAEEIFKNILSNKSYITVTTQWRLSMAGAKSGVLPVITENYTETGAAANFKKIQKTIRSKGLMCVFVQYPMRDIEPLKKLFSSDKGTIFVDNSQSFRKAVAQGSYEAYFVDHDGGNYGHSTARGYRLLAENIAHSIASVVSYGR
jgi:tetratricopeptide (TPR) repeat protein